MTPRHHSKPAARQAPRRAAALADEILLHLARHARDCEKRGQVVQLIDRALLLKKIRRHSKHSPFLVSLSWDRNVTAGQATVSSIGVFNPDAQTYSAIELFGHLFFGVGNIVPDPGLALATALPGFPQVGIGIRAVPSFPLSFGTVSFRVPNPILPGAYLGNWFLYLRGWFDVGVYLDRATFDWIVT